MRVWRREISSINQMHKCQTKNPQHCCGFFVGTFWEEAVLAGYLVSSIGTTLTGEM